MTSNVASVVSRVLPRSSSWRCVSPARVRVARVAEAVRLIGYAPSTYSAGYAPAYTAAYAPAYTTAYAPAYTTAYYASQTYTANYGGSSWWAGCCLAACLAGVANRRMPPTRRRTPSAMHPRARPVLRHALRCSRFTLHLVHAASDNAASLHDRVCAELRMQRLRQLGLLLVRRWRSRHAGCIPGPSGCSSCGQAATATTTVVVPGNQTVVVPGTQQMVKPGTQQMVVPNTTGSQSNGSGPEFSPGEQVPPRTYQKPATENGEMQPVPAPDERHAAGRVDTERLECNYFEAPKLFNPNDRTASRVAAPVHNAIYEKPASYHQVSTGPITAAQAQQDAAGWTSASN